jgi:hypothetical protein
MDGAAKTDKNPDVEPSVGIFWLFNGKLIIDSTPLSEAEPDVYWLWHALLHIKYWKRLQQQRLLPLDVEYEEPPRGRVVYDKREQRFHLYADKCILDCKDVIRQRRCMDNASNWDDIEPHIKRHGSRCWTWSGAPVEGNVYRIVAEACGAPTPNWNGKMYRMANRTVGTNSVNPSRPEISPLGVGLPICWHPVVIRDSEPIR